MSLALNTSRWSQTLWRSHLTHSQGARSLVAAGTRKQAQYGGFCDDVHGLLYLHNRPPDQPCAPAWARDLLTAAQELPGWGQLKARCLQRGFQAGVAAEALLRGLQGQIPQQDAADTPGKTPRPPQGCPGGSGGPGGDQAAGDTRRALRQALRQAAQEVDSAESAVEGAVEALGLGGGSGAGQPETLASVERVRQLHGLLQHNRVMQQMAQMAGRLQRMVASHKRGKSLDRVGAVTGITTGGELARILPTELAGLRAGRLARLQVLGKIQGKRALQYEVTGEQPETRGPVIVLLDKSGSMSDTQVAWEAAFALTLLTLCRQERRVFACVNFDWDLHGEIVVDGQADPSVLDVLLENPGGGTHFNKPIMRAIELLTQQRALRKADIFFLTDGCPSTGGSHDGNVTPETLARLAHLRDHEGLQIYGIGIGPAANLDTIRAVATTIFRMQANPAQTQDELVPVLAALA